jgi:hypothetical protein
MIDLDELAAPAPQQQTQMKPLRWWEVFLMEYQLDLKRWSNKVKEGMIEAEREAIQLERQQQALSSARLWPEKVASSPRALGAGGGGLVEQNVDEREIVRRALQGVIRISQAPAAEAEREEATWRQQLIFDLPPYAAAEVIRRAEQLRTLLDGGAF